MCRVFSSIFEDCNDDTFLYDISVIINYFDLHESSLPNKYCATEDAKNISHIFLYKNSLSCHLKESIYQLAQLIKEIWTKFGVK